MVLLSTKVAAALGSVGTSTGALAVSVLYHLLQFVESGILGASTPTGLTVDVGRVKDALLAKVEASADLSKARSLAAQADAHRKVAEAVKAENEISRREVNKKSKLNVTITVPVFDARMREATKIGGDLSPDANLGQLVDTSQGAEPPFDTFFEDSAELEEASRALMSALLALKSKGGSVAIESPDLLALLTQRRATTLIAAATKKKQAETRASRTLKGKLASGTKPGKRRKR